MYVFFHYQTIFIHSINHFNISSGTADFVKYSERNSAVIGKSSNFDYSLLPK
jgi:hypothetical protein